MTTPKLSAIVVAFDMARELPRTIRSLSPSMQRGIAASDYEILVVDNGSKRPFDEAAIRGLASNLSVHRIANATPSPVPAVNRGLELAKGELVGVFVDGARIASPGILGRALEASRLAERPVIGTIAFHLGPDVQTRSVKNGYDARVEDELLERSQWTSDGYRLFDVSVFAGSSRNGWFALPSESNALFLKKDHWRELGGFDPGFVSPGGGLANLDAWKRACESPGARVILLLGEATFHQVHGGVATNAQESPAKAFRAEYERLRGKPFVPPAQEPLFFGTLDRRALASARASLDLQLRASAPEGPSGRPIRSEFDASVFDAIQKGVMRSTYRKVPFFKSPFDIARYLRLIGMLRPRTVVEIGTKAGGSALWFADTLSAHGIEGARVVSIDVDATPEFTDERIEFLQGDAKALGAALSPEKLRSLARPWLVVEDSSHRFEDVLAVLRFFDAHLAAGDYLVVEDGIVAQLTHPRYAQFEDGPNRAVAEFLAERPGRYEIDAGLCDFYGSNATYNPNGWLRRLA